MKSFGISILININWGYPPVNHGGVDPGTVYGDVYEKDINLDISLFLEEELAKLGASVILTREGDYDLSSPNASLRKRSDFDNRIKLMIVVLITMFQYISII